MRHIARIPASIRSSICPTGPRGVCCSKDRARGEQREKLTAERAHVLALNQAAHASRLHPRPRQPRRMSPVFRYVRYLKVGCYGPGDAASRGREVGVCLARPSSEIHHTILVFATRTESCSDLAYGAITGRLIGCEGHVSVHIEDVGAGRAVIEVPHVGGDLVAHHPNL